MILQLKKKPNKKCDIKYNYSTKKNFILKRKKNLLMSISYFINNVALQHNTINLKSLLFNVEETLHLHVCNHIIQIKSVYKK